MSALLSLLAAGPLVLLYCASYYTRRGGASNGDTNWGVFLIDVRGDASNQWWNFGAALSFILHIMLIVVDLLVMDMLVVCFIFLLMEPLILLIGIVVLLYYKYTLYSSWW